MYRYLPTSLVPLGLASPCKPCTPGSRISLKALYPWVSRLPESLVPLGLRSPCQPCILSQLSLAGVAELKEGMLTIIFK